MIVIPPRRSVLSAGPTDGPWAQREASLQRIRKVGRQEWQKESGYRQQARLATGALPAMANTISISAQYCPVKSRIISTAYRMRVIRFAN